MLNNKLILMLLFLVVSIVSMSNVSAGDDTLIFTAGDAIELKGGCIYNGTYCSSAARCNVTAFYPNGTIYINNYPMTNQINYYNASLNITYTLGTYNANLFCYDSANGYSGTQPFTFDVTTTGNNMNISLWISLVLGIVSILLLLFSMYSDNEYVGFMAGIAMAVTGSYIMMYGFAFVADTYTRTIGLVTIAIGIIVFMISAFNTVGGNGSSLAAFFGDKQKSKDEYDYFEED